MNDNQIQAEFTEVLKDLAAVMKDKGMTDKEIDETILKLVTEVEMAVVEGTLETLPPHKRKMIEDMSEQNKSPEEIRKAVSLSPKKVQALEVKKFKEIVGAYFASLETKQ